MHAVTEKDLEDLEAFLDGALDLEEARALQARLANDEPLHAALDDLRAQRAIRRSVWIGNEPDSAAIMRLNVRLEESMRHAERHALWRNLSRWGTAIAACVLMGIWIGNSVLPAGSGASAPGPVVASSGGGAHGVKQPDPVGSVAGVPAEWTGGYHVSLLDETGRVQAVQQFRTLEEAREFAHDLGRWQTRRQQIRQGKIQLVADQF